MGSLLSTSTTVPNALGLDSFTEDEEDDFTFRIGAEEEIASVSPGFADREGEFMSRVRFNSGSSISLMDEEDLKLVDVVFAEIGSAEQQGR
jgi:hypothetical protein